MLTPRSLAFLQGGRLVRRARAEAQRQIQAEPALRLLPGLLDIPLAPAPLPDPTAVLAHPGPIALCGPQGSGRSLALLQLRARWAESRAAEPAIALNLAVDDAPNLSPRAVVAAAFHRAGLAAAYAEGGRPMLLLLDEWEELPADRRMLWRSYVLAAAAWPAARVLISLPADESWPGMHSLTLAPPDDDALATWLSRLLPSHDAGPILAALRHEPLAALRASTGDLLLLALTYPLSGLPASRAQLYEQAYALTRPILDESAERVSVGRAALRHYRLARGLAGGADFDSLADLPAHEIAAVAPLAIDLLGDPRPVLDLLWADGRPDRRRLRGLAACLRERPADLPEQGLRLVELLSESDEHQDLRGLIGPGLPDMFAAAARADQPRATRALARLAARWPGDLVAGLLLLLIDRPDAAAELRWAAADLLAGQPAPSPELAAPPAAADELARAARALVIALAAPDLRARLLDPQLRPGLAALLGGAGGEQRTAAAATALLGDAACPSELRAMALAVAPAGAERAPLLQQALADPSPTLRRSALAALAEQPPAEALGMLGAALAVADLDEETASDLLAAAAGLPLPQAGGLLARYALGRQRGPGLRAEALRLLAGRPDGPPLLQRFVVAAGMPALLRAAAARLLGAAGDQSAAPLLRRVLLGGGPPLLRRAAAAGLADLARGPAGRAATAALIEALARPELDAALSAQVAASLGAAGAADAIPALGTLLSPERPAALRAAWLAAAPALAHTPAEHWPALSLDPHTRAVLLDSLATGDTADDQPSSLEELGARQADLIATAAAAALATLAERQPGRRAEICARLRRAILCAPAAHPPSELIAALARAAGAQVVAELAALLDSAAGAPAVRWAALDRLAATPAAAGWLIDRLRAGADDRFTQGKLILTMGELGDERAVPALRATLTSPEVEPQRRECAAAALGQIGGPAAEAALLSLIRSGDAPAPLRAAATDALPRPLSDETRQTLRQISRLHATEPALALALARTLACAGERETLPLLLREAQSERAAQAIGAIEALGELADDSAAPVLVRISQSAIAPPGVRLAAVAALLRIDGPGQLPLLRSYLSSPIPPLRLRAHQILAQVAPDDPQLGAPASDRGAPLALRISALEQLLARSPALNLADSILLSADEPARLRIRVAAALGHSDSPAAVPALLAAIRSAGPALVRRRCVEALGALAAGEAGPPARAGLADLATGADLPAETRHWAASLILDRTFQRSIA